ncbi:MAG: flagellar biosynthesis anti-sigma factor FlgM [Terriglobales bacterium]
MRIELNNTPDPQSVSTDQAKKSSVAATANQLEPQVSSDQAALPEDQVTISSLATQALNQPEVRQGLVDSLRQSITSGQYNLDPSAIADAILNK